MNLGPLLAYRSSWPDLFRPSTSLPRKKASKAWITGTSPVMTTFGALERRRSLHRRPCELHHLAPFLGLVGYQLAEFGRRHRLGGGAQGGEMAPQLWVFAP